MTIKTHRARNKAGREWIAKVLDNVQSVTRVDIDNITDEREIVERFSVPMLRRFIEIDGRDAELFEVDDRTFVYFTGATHLRVTKYVIRTIAMAE